MDDRLAYEQLVNKLDDAAQKYYKGEKPPFTDAVYDSLCLECKAYEQILGIRLDKSPTNHISYNIEKGENVISHGDHRALSLDNTFTDDQIVEFYQNISKIYPKAAIVVEPKFDGLAGSVVIDGKTHKIKYVLNRGNGREGRVITENFLKTIKGFDPLHYLPEDDSKDVIVRGEIILEINEFHRIREAGLSDFSNPRNAVSGIMNRKDMVSLDTICTIFKPYDFFNVRKEDIMYNGVPITSGLDNPSTYKQMLEEIHYIEKYRSKLSFDIDGAVIKIIDTQIRSELGEGNKYPNWARAYKFRNVEYPTRLHRIEYSVGRTGKIAPVALFEEIDMGGVTVRAATLYNRKSLQDMRLKIGDTLRVVRSREVIPKILRSDHDGKGDIVDFITECPACGSELAIGEIDATCVNKQCPEQQVMKIVLFCSKEGLDIKGIGESGIRQLYQNNVLKNIFSVKNLCDKNIMTVISSLSGWNVTSTKNLAEEVKRILLGGVKDYVLLGSISVPLLLRTTAEKLLNKLTLPELIKELNEIKKTKDRSKFYNAYGKTVVLLDNLLDNLQYITDVYSVYGRNKHICKLIETKGTGRGLSKKGGVCVSGIFNQDRDALHKMIFDKGYDVDKSVKKSTKFLLSPSDNVSTKVTRAKKLGVKIINNINQLR